MREPARSLEDDREQPALRASVVGVGIDVADTRRFERLVVRGTTGGWARWYTETEARECVTHERPGTAAAVRFAVKEATFKAVGAHFAHELRWREIEVLADGPRWRVLLHGDVAAGAAAAGVGKLHVATCQTAQWSMATVIAQQGPDVTTIEDFVPGSSCRSLGAHTLVISASDPWG